MRNSLAPLYAWRDAYLAGQRIFYVDGKVSVESLERFPFLEDSPRPLGDELDVALAYVPEMAQFLKQDVPTAYVGGFYHLMSLHEIYLLMEKAASDGREIDCIAMDGGWFPIYVGKPVVSDEPKRGRKKVIEPVGYSLFSEES